VVVSASLVEGWSVAMLEALGCGKPLVSTEVSGIREMIIPGENCFVVESRKPKEFAKSMQDAVNLPNAAAVSTAIARRFGIAEIGRRLSQAWPQIRIEPEQAEFGKIEQRAAAAA
jgi:glycosyltransferase involved in cell wall biosynthesis